jgi:hypothetical protein
MLQEGLSMHAESAHVGNYELHYEPQKRELLVRAENHVEFFYRNIPVWFYRDMKSSNNVERFFLELDRLSVMKLI